MKKQVEQSLLLIKYLRCKFVLPKEFTHSIIGPSAVHQQKALQVPKQNVLDDRFFLEKREMSALSFFNCDETGRGVVAPLEVWWLRKRCGGSVG